MNPVVRFLSLMRPNTEPRPMNSRMMAKCGVVVNPTNPTCGTKTPGREALHFWRMRVVVRDGARATCHGARGR